MNTCPTCKSFVPAHRSSCPHCDRSFGKPGVWAQIGLLLAGSTMSVTLAACYGTPCATGKCGPPRDYPCADTTQDKDGDGYCGPFDCNENDKATHVDAYDAVGDKVDQDCDGADGDNVFGPSGPTGTSGTTGSTGPT